MANRMQYAQQLGCDAVTPDYVDANGKIDQSAYCTTLRH